MDRLKRLLVVSLLLGGCMSPKWAVNVILHPQKTYAEAAPVLPHEDVAFTGDDGATLKGWLFHTTGKRKGLLVYLHGFAANRSGGTGLAHRFVPQGWDVLMFDLRSHGDSGGAFCSYGVLEKKDLSRALDAVHADSAVLIGSSLGGSVALQAAAMDSRVRGVVAQSPFASLEMLARGRAPFFASESQIKETFALVEKEGGFLVDDASVLKSAGSIHVPVLLIHGAADAQTAPEHSQKIFAALTSPKELVLVPGADHETVLNGAPIWAKIEEFVAARGQ